MNKALLIDDEQGNLKMFRLLLKSYGYEVLTADNGRTGLEIAEKEKPHIVFTDVKMPGMDGLQVLKRIKAMKHPTEVIVITGHGDMDLAIQALNLDATDFINKPIQRSALAAALARAEERIRRAGGKENQISLELIDETAVLNIHGDVTSRSEQILLDTYRGAGSESMKQILLRFEDTSSINGAGIAILIRLLSEGKDRQQKIAITGISENLTKIFDMVGITRLATVYPDVKKALEALKQKD